MGLGLITCRRVEDVVSVLTLVRRGAAQVGHVLRVEELREQLEVEEEEGVRRVSLENFNTVNDLDGFPSENKEKPAESMVGAYRAVSTD